jgi:hypothetical protein
LSVHHKQKRLSWSNQFWIFWNSAKRFNQRQVILVHQDEKWFFGLVVCKNNKSVPFLGIEPVSHSVHHKSHINKTMAIASTAFAPFDNDMTKGGRAFKLSLDRVGGYRAAQRTTYKRKLKEDGSIHYPKRDDNISRTLFLAPIWIAIPFLVPIGVATAILCKDTGLFFHWNCNIDSLEELLSVSLDVLLVFPGNWTTVSRQLCLSSSLRIKEVQSLTAKYDCEEEQSPESRASKIKDEIQNIAKGDVSKPFENLGDKGVVLKE